MAVGYEARARVTADVSGFVTAQRAMAQAAGTSAAALTSLNNQLRETQRLAAASGAAMRPFTQSAKSMGQAQSQSANSQDELTRAMQQGVNAYAAAHAGAQQAAAAMAANSAQTQRAAAATTQSATSLRAMGRELNSLRAQQERYQTLQSMGVTLNRDQAESMATVNARIGTLTTQFIRMSAEQRKVVTESRELAQASRFATQATQEQAAAQVRLTQTGALTSAQMRSMGSEMARLTAQRRALIDVQRQQGGLDAQQASTLETLRSRLREMTGIYAQLSSEQRQMVDSSRQLAAAQGVLSSAQRELRDSTNNLDRSLWALRASVGEIEGMLYSLQNTAIQVSRAMWENFSSQEMAIAQIARVSQATTLELESIVGQVRQMSREIPIAFDELGRIAMLGSQVGVADESLVEFTETVALFSATSEVSAEETATLLARINQLAGIEDHQVRNLGSAVAFLGSNSAATDKEILTTVESIATIGNQAGLSETAIIGLGGAMASLRIRPELARGSMQRVFNQLETGVTGTGVAMERLVEITGRTQAELVAMTKADNTDEFYFTIIEALNKLQIRGENLVPVLREMGIINTRDVDVLARLAANWDVLESSVRDASTAFADGTYLYAESDRIFSTLTARVQIMANAWNEFLYNAAEAVAPLVLGLVEATTEALRFAQSIGAAPLVGWAAVILAAVAAIGTLGIVISTVVRGYVAWRGIMLATNGSLLGNTAATAANTAAMGANTVATGTNTAVKGTNAAATTAAAAANTGLAASATAASRAMLLMAVANPATTILVAVAAIVAATVAMDALGNSTDQARQKLLDAHETHLNAAGGMNSLTAAIDADTAAWRNAQQAAAEHISTLDNTTSAFSSSAAEILNNSRYRIETTGDMAEADRIAAEEAQALSERQQDLAESLGTATSDADTAADALDRVGSAADDAAMAGSRADNSIGQLNGSVQANTTEVMANQRAIGLATRQIAALSLESAAVESGILDTAESFEAFTNSGADLSIALTKEMQNAGDGAEYLRGKAAQVREEMGFWEGFLSSENAPWGEHWYSQSERAARGMEYMAENLDATSISIEEANRQTELMTDTLIRLPDGTAASVEQLQEFTDVGGEAAITAMVMENEVGNLGISISELTTAFVGFMDPLTAWNDAQQEANDLAGQADAAFAQLGVNADVTFTSFLANMEEMSAAQMNWSNNLLAIADRVPPEVLAGLAEMGVEGAGIVNGLVNASDTEVQRFVELWQQGAGTTSDTFGVMFADFLLQAQASGDTGGTAFVSGLMEQVAAGDISFSEMVDQMTAYAEEEFANSDPTTTPEMDNTEAIRELTSLIRRIERETREADAETEVEVETGGAWNTLVNWWNAAQRWLGSSPLWAGVQVLGGSPGRGNSRGPGRKDGGWIGGASGGPRQDNIPIMASRDEFMVNARDAAWAAPLLEWVNNGGGGRMPQVSRVPNYVPDNIMNAPRKSLPPVNAWQGEDRRRSAATRRQFDNQGWVINVNNQYPQAEPTSVTINRSLQYAAALNGVQ